MSSSIHFAPLPSDDIDDVRLKEERKYAANAASTVPLTLEEALAALAEARQQIRELELKLNLATASETTKDQKKAADRHLQTEESVSPDTEHFAIVDESDRPDERPSTAMLSLEVEDSSEAGHIRPPHGSLEDEYWKLSIWQILAKRLPWLVGLLLLQSFSGEMAWGSLSFAF